MSKQLTLEQRYVISTMRQNGATYQAIADEITRIERERAQLEGIQPPKPRSASTIQREIKRNSTKTGKYNPAVANSYALERRKQNKYHARIDPSVLHMAIKLLKEKRWSPQQISGYLAKQGQYISAERIYQEIRLHPELAKYCHHKMKYRRHQAKIYKTAGKTLIPDRISIHERPPEADGSRFGDWEMDLVMGANQKSQVLTIIERSKNMFFQTKLPSKKPNVVAKAVIRLLLPYKKNVLTITTDNGIEFRDHIKIAKALDCTVYFADPYCSGQKGAVENANKIFREFFPKGTDFNTVTQHQLDNAQYMINDRPRKKINFSSPKIEFFNAIS